MKIQIKHRFNGNVIFETDAENLGQAVLIALKAKSDLRSANLSYANLSYADLSYADLSYADLSSADLSSANLSYADLSYANLSYADLSSADLSYADLSSANLSYADLSYADLSSADLRYADLSSANLRSADLSYANLSYADLSSANLSYADLSSANLRSANLSYADLSYAINSELIIAMTRLLPGGDLIGWKKCRNGALVKLLIPADAKRSNAFGRKCRAEFVKVLEVICAEGITEAVSHYDSSIVYRVGEIVRPTEKFCEDFTQECAAGIHFYITRLEAENHAP